MVRPFEVEGEAGIRLHESLLWKLPIFFGPFLLWGFLSNLVGLLVATTTVLVLVVVAALWCLLRRRWWS